MENLKEEASSQLERIVSSPGFVRADRARRFLVYVVESVLADAEGDITERDIALNVFDRGQDFDPRIDSIVRVEAGRVRSKLLEFYQTHAAEPIVFDLPRGTYVPKVIQSAAGGAAVARLVSDETGVQATVAPESKQPSHERSNNGRRNGTWKALIIAALLLCFAYTLSLWRHDSSQSERITLRLAVLPPTGVHVRRGFLALVPTGKLLAFVAAESDSIPKLWVRELDSGATRKLEGTDGASLPFWSPDGEWLAFFSGGKLRRAPLGGGAPEIICDAADGRGGTWGHDGSILFAPTFSSPIYRVDASGGRPAPVTTLDRELEENGHSLPVFLPDGKHFLFLVYSSKTRELWRVRM